MSFLPIGILITTSCLIYIDEAAVMYGSTGTIYRGNAYRNFNIGSISTSGCRVTNGSLYINGQYRGQLTPQQQEQLAAFQERVASWSINLRDRILMKVRARLSGDNSPEPATFAAAAPFPAIPAFCYGF